MTRDARRAYRVVDDFEAELCSYTGAPHAVAVSSCTNALLLALTWRRLNGGGIAGAQVAGDEIRAVLPPRTYVGVLQSVLNAGYTPYFVNRFAGWQERGFYSMTMPPVVCDSARMICQGRYVQADDLVCLSFHAAKQLPLGRGGAILTDNEEAADWFRAARMDGRPPGEPIEATVFPGFHCPMPPDVAARGLDILSRWNDRGYSPPPLPHEDYPDLSLIYPPGRNLSGQQTERLESWPAREGVAP